MLKTHAKDVQNPEEISGGAAGTAADRGTCPYRLARQSFGCGHSSHALMQIALIMTKDIREHLATLSLRKGILREGRADKRI